MEVLIFAYNLQKEPQAKLRFILQLTLLVHCPFVTPSVVVIHSSFILLGRGKNH